MKEIWKSILEKPWYMVSDTGRVRNTRTGHYLTPSKNNSGYYTVSLGRDTPGRFIHRLVAEAFVDGCEPGLDVNHKNGDKTDNRRDNLEWCTRRDNVKHAFAIGLAKGHKPPNAGTPPKQVRIVETGQVYESQAECARAVGGSVGAISQCLHGARKKHHGYHYEYVETQQRSI